MSRTEYDPTPYAHDVLHGQDTTMPHPTSSSADVEQRNVLAVQACAMHRARAVAQAAPEIRVAQVAAARRALQEGTLPLDGQALAETLLRAARLERRHA